jgi:hypothetical protein
MAYEQLIDAGIGAAIAGAILTFTLIVIGLYIYMSFAFMAIAKKAKLKNPGLAWIPGVGPTIIAYQTSKMHWWPWLLLIGTLIPAIGGLFSLAFFVFTIIWMWKMFEAIKQPGWWSIFILIFPIWLVFIGVAAWSKK